MIRIRLGAIQKLDFVTNTTLLKIRVSFGYRTVFLKDGIGWARYNYFDLKNHASIVEIAFAGYAITNIYFFESLFLLGFVPDENIGNNLEDLCIGWSNLKYLDDEIVDANLKRIGNAILFP